jgi:hypothetical protein
VAGNFEGLWLNPQIEKLYLESKEERNNILENDSVLGGEFGLDNEMNKSKKKI